MSPRARAPLPSPAQSMSTGSASRFWTGQPRFFLNAMCVFGYQSWSARYSLKQVGVLTSAWPRRGNEKPCPHAHTAARPIPARGPSFEPANLDFFLTGAGLWVLKWIRTLLIEVGGVLTSARPRRGDGFSPTDSRSAINSAPFHHILHTKKQREVSEIRSEPPGAL